MVAILRALYLFAPLLLASALSALVLRYDLVPSLRRPIDAGLTLRGRRLFGDSKTWRGVVVAIVGCIAGVAVQRHLIGDRIGSIAVLHYDAVDVWSFGAAMGSAAMLGELPNSFTKRQLGIAPGKTTGGPLRVVFYVWDQVDLLTVTWPVLACWVPLDPAVIATSFALAMVVHPTVSLIGYGLGARTSAR